MKKFNRLYAIIMTVALSLTVLSGCGSTETNDSVTTEAETAAVVEEAVETAADEGETASESEDSAAEEASDDAAAEDSDEIKHITLTVTYKDGHSDDFAIDTSAEFLKEAIENDVELGGQESDYGFYIESVTGEAADYSADSAYWAIYVNDEYGMYGVDSQPVADGDSFALIYTIG